jgi:hypothetical protein
MRHSGQNLPFPSFSKFFKEGLEFHGKIPPCRKGGQRGFVDLADGFL